MKSTLLGVLFVLVCTTGIYAQTTDNYTTDKQLNGVWWNVTYNTTPAYMQSHHELRGAMVAFDWSELQPNATGPLQWINSAVPKKGFDSSLHLLTLAGFKVCLLIYTGPAAPLWLYSAPYNVPKYTSTDPDTYPEYKNATYQAKWYTLIDSVLKHISTLDTSIRNNIVIYQSCEGSTGDEVPFHGIRDSSGVQVAWPYDSRDSGWVILRDSSWAYTNRKLRAYFPSSSPSGSNMTLLVNPGNSSDLIIAYTNFVYFDTLNRKLNHTWLKAGSVGHGYQLNTEDTQHLQYNPYINAIVPPGSNRTRVRSRSEMDEFNGWFNEAPKWNMYWQAINAAYFGLDCWMLAFPSLETADYQPGFNFFNKYAGLKGPDSTDKGFCALRDGLDASDFTRFSATTYGSGDINTFSSSSPSSRAYKIVSAFTSYGAKQEDWVSANGQPMKQRNASAFNDVGWDIFPGNYERFITQINVPTGVYRGGYWRKGPFVTGTSTPKDSCGRFAKGFDNANSINSFYFDVNDSLKLTANAGGSKKVTLKITYLDEGTGNSWKLIYYKKVGTTFTKITTTIANTNAAKDTSWKVYSVNVDSFWIKNQIAVTGGSNADIQLQNVGTGRQLFHMIEISNQPGAGPKMAAPVAASPVRDNQLSVYPNPGKGLFTVAWSAARGLPASVLIVNTGGSVVYAQDKITAGSVLINIRNEPAGVYYVEVTAGGQRWRSKIIKE